MKYLKNLVLIIFSLVLLASCSSINIYKINFNETDFDSYGVSFCIECEPEVKEIAKNRTKFFEENDKLMRDGFICVGYSQLQNSFPGNFRNAMSNFGKEIGVSKIIAFTEIAGVTSSTIYTSSEEESSFEGSRIGTYSNISSKGSRIGTYSNGSSKGSRIGESSTYNNNINNNSTSDNYVLGRSTVFYHTIFYYKKIRSLPSFGMVIDDLNEKDIENLKRNTGVYVSLIFNNSYAYNSNINEGDIIIKLDDFEINEVGDFNNFVANLDPNSDSINVKLFRNEKIVEIILKLE
jgi:hypothetical protein